MPTLMASENIVLPLFLRRKDGNKRRINEVLQMGLADRDDHLPEQLSSGRSFSASALFALSRFRYTRKERMRSICL